MFHILLYIFRFCISCFIFYFIYSIFQYFKKTVLHFISLYLPLDDFCIDMPDDGLRKGRNV